MSPQSRAVKTLLSQWGRLRFRNGVFCRKWEIDIGDQSIDQNLLPNIFRQTSFEAHHSHMTTSWCTEDLIRSSVSLLLARTYIGSSQIMGSTAAMFVDQRKCGEGNVVHP